MFSFLTVFALWSVLVPACLPHVVRGRFPFPIPFRSSRTTCNLDHVRISLPSNQSMLAVPAQTHLRFLAIGVGVQNYTCSSAGTFTSVGALATLFDASCIANTSLLNDLPTALFDASQANAESIAYIADTRLKLGDHLFVTNPITGSGIVARFDFTSSQNNRKAFFEGTKTGDVLAPANPTSNVDWLQLSLLQGQGQLATSVFRIQTKGGQPPTSCAVGQTTSIPYAAQYWFFK